MKANCTVEIRQTVYLPGSLVPVVTVLGVDVLAYPGDLNDARSRAKQIVATGCGRENDYQSDYESEYEAMGVTWW